MEFVVKHFSILYPDITYAEVESTFLLAYINTWGFHVPGPDPDSQGKQPHINAKNIMSI